MEDREQLQKMRIDELAAICKERGITHYRGKSRFKKDELVSAILENEQVSEKKEYVKPEITEVDNQTTESVSKVESDVDKQKLSYIESAECGTIVACIVEGKMKSAKIVKKSTSKKRLMIETAYGATYVVAYEDVRWVRTGSKWPRGVYRELKGLKPDDVITKGSGTRDGNETNQ